MHEHRLTGRDVLAAQIMIDERGAAGDLGRAFQPQQLLDRPVRIGEQVAAVGLGSLFSSRLLRPLLGRDPIDVADEVFISTWVQMIQHQITA